MRTRSFRHHFAPATLIAVGLVLPAACSEDTQPVDPDTGPDRQQLLADVANNAILPIYRDVVTAANGLEQSLSTYVDQVGAEGEASARSDAQESWRTLMAAWQQAELFQLGPAGMSGRVIGGQNIRDEIYSWPTTNTCKVDQETVANEFEAANYFDGKLVTGYGLDALEYLLFLDTTDNTCSPVLSINSEGQWDAIPPAERVDRRARFALAMSGKVKADAEALVSAWEASGGNFLADFSTAGDAGSSYATERDALNDLFAALFYLELTTKDDKLALPAGIHPDCITERCPESLELARSAFSRRAVLNNLIGFEKGLTAGAGVGFEDLLRELGAGELADAMIADTQAAIQALEGMNEFSTALSTNSEDLDNAHAAVKKVTDALKSQFVSVLNLDVPQEGAGDND